MKRFVIPIVVAVALIASIWSLFFRNDVTATIEMPEVIEAGGTITVTVTINKGNVTNFARFQQDIPAGLTVSAGNSASADFSFEDQKLRLVWLSLPKDDKITFSYSITADERLKGNTELGGQFSYIVGNERHSVALKATPLAVMPSTSIDPSQIVDIADYKSYNKYLPVKSKDNATTSRPADKPATSTAATDKPTSTPTPTDKPAETVTAQASTEQSTIIADTPPDPETKASKPASTPQSGTSTTRPTPQNNTIYFKVQIAAGHRPVNAQRYFRRLGIDETVDSEQHEGWYKYLVGNFNYYRDARDFRVHLRNTTRLNGAFVTAYNGGQRITVQEALMSANQKWIK